MPVSSLILNIKSFLKKNIPRMFDEFNKAGRGGDNNMAAVDQIDLKPINVTGLDSSGGFKLDKSWGALVLSLESMSCFLLSL